MAKGFTLSSNTIPSTVEVLNETSLLLLEIKEEREIYKILASALSKIIPGAICMVSKLQPDKKSFRVVQMYGVEKYLQAVMSILGKDPYELDFPFATLLAKHKQAFDSRKLYHYEEGLYGITVGTINKATCKAIEMLGGISDIFTTCFFMDNTYYGGLTLLVPKHVMDSGIMNKDAILAIETLSNLATVLIHKLQVNKELSNSKQQLQEMISAKDKIFSIIAHDLKSPFNSFIGLTDILLQNNKTISDENRLLYIRLLHESAVSTYKLLDNLLEWSRLHLSNYEINQETIHLKNILDDCIDLYHATSENKKIRVCNEVPPDTSAFADGRSIHTVLRNLLNNALKYTPSGGQITFTAETKQHVVELSIQDTGVGIKPDLLPNLFKIGENKSTLGTKMEKGTGIGLVLCKELLEINGGYIRVETKLGKGSTFIIGLPNNPDEPVHPLTCNH